MFGGWGETEASVCPSTCSEGRVGAEGGGGGGYLSGGGSENRKGDNGLHGAGENGHLFDSSSLIQPYNYPFTFPFTNSSGRVRDGAGAGSFVWRISGTTAYNV